MFSKIKSFNYFLPVNVVFGNGTFSELGKRASAYGDTALIVTGTNSTKRTGVLDKAIKSLQKEGMKVFVYDEVTPNPLTTTAIKGSQIAKKHDCNVIIGLGGGSIMDCAKAIAFLAVNDGDISDYIYNVKVSDKALPIVLVPTTCGTGSEGNGFAVLTNPDNGDKKSLRCNAIVSKVSIVDPELMKSMPKKILASVGFDALCHNMEAYTSKLGNPISDMMCLWGIEAINKSLVPLYNDVKDDTLWEGLSFASTLGGMVIHQAGVTLPHGMEHPASGLKDIVHGRGLAALTPVIYDASIKIDSTKYTEIAKAFGRKHSMDLVPAIRRMLDDLELTTSLSNEGIEEKDIDWMVDNCFKVSKASIENHPVLFDRDALKELYKLAL